MASRVKVAFRDQRRAVSYAELEARTRRIAGHLAQLRLQPGDRVAILLGNRVEMVESYLATTRASAVGQHGFRTPTVHPLDTHSPLLFLHFHLLPLCPAGGGWDSHPEGVLSDGRTA
jgi:non-ribosomal peptide synthetase component F